MDDLVAVIGGGPAGLAVAATLREAGVPVRVFDQGDEVGARWRDHYDRLHLHTARGLSGLPGMAIPPEVGRWRPRSLVGARRGRSIDSRATTGFSAPGAQVSMDRRQARARG